MRNIEDEIMERLNSGKKVIIDSGACNDKIISYSVRKFKEYVWQTYFDREVTFTTTACVFPRQIALSDYDNVETEEFQDVLFIHVS